MSNASNDFEADLYELNKMVDKIFEALAEMSIPEVFSFAGKEVLPLKDSDPSIGSSLNDPRNNFDWDMKCPVAE